MDFFDKLGKKASEAYKMTADKTGKIAKETKIKLKIGELKSKINDIYEEIGKKVYEKHVTEELDSIKDEIEEKCTQIDVLSDEIESLLKQCLELNDKKQCPKCYTQIEKDVKFCPNCGEKQVEEKPKEAEILEDVESHKVEEDNDIEAKIDLEKTVTIESNVDVETQSNLEKTVAIESTVEIEKDEEEKNN